MKDKLTLSMSREAVIKAKRISARTGKSVSQMMEDFINNIPETPRKSAVEEMIELMAPYRDKINASLPEGKSYRDMVREWRYEDYLKKSAEREQPPKKTKSKRNENGIH